MNKKVEKIEKVEAKKPVATKKESTFRKRKNKENCSFRSGLCLFNF